MKKYEHLHIIAEEEKLSELMENMRKDSRIFKYLKKTSDDYAKNIFVTASQAICFKSTLDSMYHCTVWLVHDKNIITLTNITPESASRISIVDYNIILNSFFQEVIEPLINEEYNVQISGEDVQLSNILGEDVYSALVHWESSCNKSAPISHPNDNQRWMHFICLLFDSGIELNPADFIQWLQEDCNWPIGYNLQIEEIAIKLEYSIELLKTYTHED